MTTPAWLLQINPDKNAWSHSTSRGLDVWTFEADDIQIKITLAGLINVSYATYNHAMAEHNIVVPTQDAAVRAVRALEQLHKDLWS